MLVFAATILVSAFLLFQVQPLIGKIILPWFGGAASVWAAVLLFFQCFLLGGYAYSHFVITRLKPRVQMIVHLSLLAASCALLPILPSPSWKPTSAADPTLRILALLAVTVGLPYFLLSSTSPLLQAWYVRRTGGRAPYRLFALSNFGSMVGLLSFPFLVEPSFTSRQQAFGWSAVYVAFVLLCAWTAWVSRREALPRPIGGGALQELAPTPPDVASEPQRPGWKEILLWLGLAACASTLLVAVTAHLTQNVAPVPLLWVVPLALYLLTFILAFESDRFYRRVIFLPLLAVALGLMSHLLHAERGSNIRWLMPTFALGLFVCCMVCHGELAQRRPHPRYLTLFFLIVSLGGALGGVFVATIAPRVFDSYLELPLALVACGFLAVTALFMARVPKVTGAVGTALLVFAVVFLAGYLGRQELRARRGYDLRTRNFYGTLTVYDTPTYGDSLGHRTLLHGTISHGYELLTPGGGRRPTSYYGRRSGISRALEALGSDRRIGVLGLGAGVSASLAREGDVLHYYEINPAVQDIAEERFSFLRSTPADIEIFLGDGRLVLERRPDERLDFLAMDAFTSDAIPMHLLTREAFQVYLRHLEPDGVLAVNVTNRYVNLVPVVARAAETLGKRAMLVTDLGSEKNTYYSDWVLVTSREGFFEDEAFKGARLQPATAPPGFRGWTDDYSNLAEVLLLG